MLFPLFARRSAARLAQHASGFALLACVLALTCAESAFAESASAKKDLVVVTGYPAAFTQVFVTAYEAKHPDVAVQILRKSGREALTFLSAQDHGGADVYWAASGNFAKLDAQGVFAAQNIDRAALPGKLDGVSFIEPQSHYEAFELAGYGFAYAPKGAWADKPAPTRWQDAAAPDLEGKIIMPIDGKVGYAAALYEIILQGEGWEKGWALLSEISGNATVTANPHDLNPLETGSAALSLTIDFIPLEAAAKGAPLAAAYPQKTAFLPAYVARLANAPHAQAAASFVDFLLSQEGQKLLLTPGINRYPVRPDSYPTTGDTVDPFKLPATLLVAFDAKRAEARRPLDAALFEAAFVVPHQQLVVLWHKIHAAEAALKAHPDAARARQVEEARKLAGSVPVTATDADDPTFLARFGKEGGKGPDAIIAQWTGDLATARDKAAALLESAAQ